MTAPPRVPLAQMGGHTDAGTITIGVVVKRTREPMCQVCAAAPIDIHHGDAALCDRCFDARLAEEILDG